MSNVAYTSHVEELGGSSSAGSFQLTADGGVLEGISRVQQEKKGHPNKARLSVTSSPEQPPAATKRKRSLAGTPDPDAEVIALSPRTLLATNRFVCEICNKGFQRDQNLQLHRRGHNLPWKLKQTRITGGPKEGQQNSGKKRVYVCPEENCVHHHPSRALGDLTGIKKHFCRKHGEKKWKCDKCSKRYAVQSDWKAHLKTCGTREYRCDCGTLFSRRDSFITHRAFCDALAEENTRAAPHTQGDQSGDDANQCPSEEPSIGAPHISHSQVNRGPSDLVPSFSETAMPSMPTKNCENPMNVGGIASLTSKWFQGAASPVLRKGSGLPSWLDSGPLPGLPGPMKGFLGIPSSLAMNEVGSSSPSEASNDAMHRGSLSNNCSAGGLLATLFPSGSNNSGPNGLGMRRVPSASNLTSGMSSFAGLMNNADKGKFGSMTSTSSLFDHQQQQQHSAAAQLSATALLQKAAQMGATASSTTLFRGFSPAAGDSSLSSHGKGPEGAAGTRQAPRQEPKRGGLDSIFAPSYTNTGRYGERSHLPGSSILGHGRTSLEVSDKTDSLSGQQLWGGGFGHASSFDTSSQSGYVHQQHADNFNMLEDSETSVHHGRSHFEAGTRGGTENHHEDRYGATTHDFLGVGAMSRIGRSTSMGQDFSQGSRTQYFNKFNK